jgi:hypothetical protein
MVHVVVGGKDYPDLESFGLRPRYDFVCIEAWIDRERVWIGLVPDDIRKIISQGFDLLDPDQLSSLEIPRCRDLNKKRYETTNIMLTNRDDSHGTMLH